MTTMVCPGCGDVVEVYTGANGAERIRPHGHPTKPAASCAASGQRVHGPIDYDLIRRTGPLPSELGDTDVDVQALLKERRRALTERIRVDTSIPLTDPAAADMIRDAPRVTFVDPTTYETDWERGRLNEKINGAIQAMVDVRARVKDDALRDLLIAELERIGYTVTPPGTTDEKEI